MSNTALAEVKPKAELVKIGSRSVSISGFRHDFLEEHLDEHRIKPESEQWCSPECLSRIIFGRNTPNNRAGVRKRLSRAFREMLKRHRFLAIEYASRGNGHNGEAIAFKFVEANEAGQARQYAIDRLEKMRRHLRMTEAELEIAKALLKID